MTPNSVAYRAKQAEELIARNRELANTMPTGAPNGAAEPAEPAEPPADPNEGAPQAEEQHELQAEQGQDDDNGEPAFSQQGADDAPDDGAQNVDYEHRFRVLQGKYNAETKRSREQITKQEQRIDRLQELLANLSAQPKAAPRDDTPPPPKAKPVSVPTVQPLSDRDYDEFGKDLLEAAARHTMVKLEPLLSDVAKQITELRKDVSTTSSATTAVRNTVQQTKKAALHEALTREVPDWEAINRDEDFKEWVRQEDPRSGEPLSVLLGRAYDKGDARRVIQFFKDYKAEHATTDEPEPRPSRMAPPAPGADAPAGTRHSKVDPGSLVAPRRGRAAPRNGTQQDIIWTPNDISMFYADVKNGRYKGNSAERDRLEADIYRAQTEGRVQFQ